MKVRILWISAPLSVLIVFVLDSVGCREEHGIQTIALALCKPFDRAF